MSSRIAWKGAIFLRMERDFVNRIVTRDMVDDIFGGLVASSGGWRPALMSDYIQLVFDTVIEKSQGRHEWNNLRKETIRKLRELDPMLFQR